MFRRNPDAVALCAIAMVLFLFNLPRLIEPQVTWAVTPLKMELAAHKTELVSQRAELVAQRDRIRAEIAAQREAVRCTLRDSIRDSVKQAFHR